MEAAPEGARLPPGAEFAGRRVAVVGLQRSNAAVARCLARAGALLEAYDRQPAERLDAYAAALPPGAPLFTGPDYLERLEARLDGLAAVFVTPGMRKDLPALRRAAEAGIPLWTEAAYVLARHRDRSIGITGSAGKTTTTSLVGEAVTRHRPGSLVGGNIGTPLVDRLADLAPGGLLVMELSSFQLELCRHSPHLAAVLNIRPNHLDVHGSLDAYVDAKRRIYRFQRDSDACVFGADDPGAAGLAPEAPAGVLYFSGTREVTAGAGVRDGTLWWFRPGAPPRPILPAADVRLPGAHNVQNVAAAAALCLAAGLAPKLVAEVVRGFGGVEHRLETVREWRGALWVNDSIATAPDRVAAALDAFAGRPLVLLAGGYDKGLPLEDLGRRIAERVERVVLFGAAAGRLRAAVVAGAVGLGRAPEMACVRGLDEAVALAAEGVRPGQVILLSPACASFDEFRDFEERGRRFKARVAALPD